MSDTSTLLDSSALIALLNTNDDWHEAAKEAFIERKKLGIVYIDDIVFAEASAGFDRQVDFEAAIAELGLARWTASNDSLFRAGQVYRAYKQSPGLGKKDGVLPDFIIGAVAEKEGMILLTANGKDFVNRFPDLELLSIS